MCCAAGVLLMEQLFTGRRTLSSPFHLWTLVGVLDVIFRYKKEHVYVVLNYFHSIWKQGRLQTISCHEWQHTCGETDQGVVCVFNLESCRDVWRKHSAAQTPKSKSKHTFYNCANAKKVLEHVTERSKYPN